MRAKTGNGKEERDSKRRILKKLEFFLSRTRFFNVLKFVVCVCVYMCECVYFPTCERWFKFAHMQLCLTKGNGNLIKKSLNAIGTLHSLFRFIFSLFSNWKFKHLKKDFRMMLVFFISSLFIDFN